MNLLPTQFGVGTKGGVEPLVHYTALAGHTRCIHSVDLKNAFNTMKRSFIWAGVRDRAPELLNTFKWSYSDHSTLVLPDGSELLSKSGVRQGDPLGPVFFSLGYSQVVTKFNERFESVGMLTK